MAYTIRKIKNQSGFVYRAIIKDRLGKQITSMKPLTAKPKPKYGQIESTTIEMRLPPMATKAQK